MKRFCICLVLPVLAIPAAASADPATFAVPARQTDEFSLPAAHGYRIEVSTDISLEGPRSHTPAYVWITARHGVSQVVYLARALAKRPGVIRARLPGVGRIAVRFHTFSTGRRALPPSCEGPREAVLRGVFEGMIVIHGERGYTTLDRKTAPGRIVRSSKETCPVGQSSRELREKVGEVESALAHGLQLYAGPAVVAGETVNFLAARIHFKGRPFTFFEASASRLRRGMLTLRTVIVPGGEVLAPHPWGVLRDASVTPHGPFTGSAAFHLESTASASWKGDLQVELPGLAPVALTGPDWPAKLCEDSRCAPRKGRGSGRTSSLTTDRLFRWLGNGPSLVAASVEH